MFEDLRYLIRDAKVPESAKLALSVLTKAIGWFAFAFVIIGLFLNRQYFIYWLAFILFIEGLLVAALIAVLLMAVRAELPNPSFEESGSTKTPKANKFRIGDVALRGVIGHAAFYLLLLAVLIILGAMGVFEEAWQAVLHRLSAR